MVTRSRAPIDGVPTPERLGAVSDGVFSIIITIMVLELKPPPEPSFAAVYAAVFALVNSAYVAFVWEVLAQAEVQNKVSPRMRRVTRVRSIVTLGMFSIATIVSLKFPVWGFVLVPCVLFVHLRPVQV
jgi:uncharacterized membrane protein